MSKKVKATVIQIVVGLVIGLFLGILSISMLDQMDHFGIDTALYFIVMFIIAFILQIVIHEGGHCLFGLKNGFEFVSFRIGSYMWVLDNGKIQLKRYKLAGTGGQCLMNPSVTTEKGYILYLLGGGICNIASGLILLILGLIFKDLLFSIFCFANITIALLLGTLNLIPMDVGIPNDGYNAYIIIKDKKSAHSLYQQLVIAKELADGKRLDEMDDSLFTLYEGADLLNPLNTCIAVNRNARLLAQNKLEEAKEGYLELRRLKISEIFKTSTVYALSLIEVLTSEKPNVDQYLSKQMKKKLESERSDITALLVQYGIELLVNKNEGQARLVLKYLMDAYETYPYRGEVEVTKEAQKQLEERVNSND